MTTTRKRAPQVIVGFVAIKRYKTEQPDPKHEGQMLTTWRDKKISRRFHVRDAADVFVRCAIAQEAKDPCGDEAVQFYVREEYA